MKSIHKTCTNKNKLWILQNIYKILNSNIFKKFWTLHQQVPFNFLTYVWSVQQMEMIPAVHVSQKISDSRYIVEKLPKII